MLGQQRSYSSSARQPSKETRSARNQIHELQITFIEQICIEASNLYTFPRMLGREGDQGAGSLAIGGGLTPLLRQAIR